MLFALLDYFRYRRRPGRFGNLGMPSLMSRAFRGSLPPELVQVLQPADLLFIQTLNSLLSWLIMYLTKSEISHVAFYAGNRTISHSTTDGAKREQIKVLFDKDKIILPCSLPLTTEQRSKMDETLRKMEGKPYNWQTVFTKGFRIIFGRDPLYFRFTFVWDIVLMLLILDLPFLFLKIWPKFSLLLLPYLIAVAVNMVVAHFKPLLVTKNSVVKPVEIFLEASTILGGSFHLKKASSDT